MNLEINIEQPAPEIDAQHFAQHSITELSTAEIEEVSGGFVCGGACVGGLFVLGAGVGYAATSYFRG